VQTPELIGVTVLPETVQIAVVIEVKLTVSPEVAVAVKVSVPEPTPNVKSVRGENEIVWGGS
jgi:Ni,Fe-hydrogenase III component G